MTQQSHTPTAVCIKPRNREFEISDALSRDWYDNNAFITAWHNALSITFPEGEKFFIDSVRHYADEITDEKLKAEIRAFCGQEGFHRREHEQYNRILCEQRGYDLNLLEGRVKRRIKETREQQTPITQLAITVGLEHITAVMAEFHLGVNSPARGKAEPVMEQLWQWHGAEELEHKSVAFDVYRAVGGSEELRIRILKRVTFLILWRTLTGMLHMFRKDGNLLSIAVWRQGYDFLWGKQGLFKFIAPNYKEFFRPDFHPWQNDSLTVLDEWQQSQALS